MRAGVIQVRLGYRQPADLDGVLAFLALRAVPGIEEVTDRTYRRSLVLPHGPAVVELTPEDGYVRAALRLSDPRDLSVAVAHCRRTFDLDADPLAVDAVLAADPVMLPLTVASPGLRVPGTPDVSELTVRAVLGQQVSVAAARAIAGRLVAEFGRPLDVPVGAVTHTFPGAETLAAADPSRFPMPRSRQRTIHELTSRLADGRIRLDPGADRDEVEATLVEVPGIGPWTSGYVRMRALGDPDVFLPTDLGVRHGLARLGLPVTASEARDMAERWRPWRSYALLHIWTTTPVTPRYR